MHRFFLPHESISGDTITISSRGQLRHVKHVLRLRKGQKVCVFDDNSVEYEAVVDRIEEASVSLNITAKKSPSSRPGVCLTIACALAKQAKMDDIVDKLTQLGVQRIIPLNTERVIVRWDAAQRARHLRRWQSIAVSAAQQSQGNCIPRVDPVTDFDDLLAADGEYDLKMIPTLAEDLPHIGTTVHARKPSRILVAIGPEGDFSSAEVARAVRQDFLPVSLGSRVLRVDTAVVSVAAYLHFHAEG